MKVGFLAVDSREWLKDYDTPQPYFGTAPQAVLQGFAHLPEIEVHVVSCVKKPVADTPKIAPNIYYHSLLVPGGWARTLYTRCVLATRRKLGELQPDLVHGQGSERDCALASVYSGLPNIITIHGNMREIRKVTRPPFFSFLTLQTMLESWAIRRTQGVLCLTNYARKHVEGRTARTWVLPNAVNESYFNLARSETPSSEILCIANIDPRKNQNLLIRALDPIAATHGMRLVFMGTENRGHPYFEEFLSLVKERPWCVYEGFKRGAEVYGRIQSARMVILPSLEENCPMVVLEAMAIGAPVAAARSGGTPDLIEDRVTGLMFDPKSPEAIRAATLKLFNDEGTARAMAAAGRKRALERHHPARIAEKHVEIYREVLRGRC